MKLIFSRKGFDSGSGGCPSPILPDGSMLALPIPDSKSVIRYRDLEWAGHNVGALVERLTRGKVRARDGAHLDPDLRREQLPRHREWRPLLGQSASAQGHLRKQNVGRGDVFVFWGLFRRVDEELRWVGPKLHVIWGWLEVGEVVKVEEALRERPARLKWAASHPHLAYPDRRENTLYLASDEAGSAGVFDSFEPSLQLTLEGAKSPTIWLLPKWMLPNGRRPLSYHAAPERWSIEGRNVLLQSVSRGQEFVLDATEYPEATEWVRAFVKKPCRRWIATPIAEIT